MEGGVGRAEAQVAEIKYIPKYKLGDWSSFGAWGVGVGWGYLLVTVHRSSLTLSLRVQVQDWGLEGTLWTDHSSWTDSRRPETLLWSPLPPHNHSSSDLKSVWEINRNTTQESRQEVTHKHTHTHTHTDKQKHTHTYCWYFWWNTLSDNFALPGSLNTTFSLCGSTSLR